MPKSGDLNNQDISSLIGLADDLTGINSASYSEDLKEGLSKFFNKYIIKDLAKYNDIIYCSLPFWWHQVEHDGSWFKDYMPVRVFHPENHFKNYNLFYYLLDKKLIDFSFADFACRNLKTIPELIKVSFTKGLDDIKPESKDITTILSLKAPVKGISISSEDFEGFVKLFHKNVTDPQGDIGHYEAIVKNIEKFDGEYNDKDKLIEAVKDFIRLLGKTEKENSHFLKSEWFKPDETGKPIDREKLEKNFRAFIRLHPIIFGKNIRHIVFAPSKVFYTDSFRSGGELYPQSYGGLIAVIGDPEAPKTKDERTIENVKQIDEVFNLIRAKTSIKFREWAAWDWAQKSKKDLISHSTKSAIAAIMSRNGSHNIGSHVIAAVTNGLSDLPDDQTLFAYIQHRMDFIATITTEFSEWSYPVWFVKDLMRRFYMQRHLLNYIASSEGLRAFERQDQESEQTDRLILKVRYSEDGSNLTDIIDPTDTESETGKIEKDVLVAIPGGIIGHQAFYTILENIIRNSAKHGFESQIKGKRKNLEITIDLIDDKNTDYVKVRIWDNISSISNGEYFDLPKGHESESIGWETSTDEQHKNNFSRLPLHQKMNCRLARSFINRDTGELVRENWGLAEMKIAVGYLNWKSIEEISDRGERLLFKDNGSDVNGNHSGILRATTTKDDNTKRLTYEFAIPRPKEVLIVGHKNDELPKEKLRHYSIYFEDDIHEKRLDYEFMVLDCSENKCYDKNEIAKLPARLFLVADNSINSDIDVVAVRLNTDEFKNQIEKLVKDEKDGDENFKLWLYSKWIKHLETRCGFDSQPTLNIILGGKDSEVRQDKDFLKRVFELAKKGLPEVLNSLMPDLKPHRALSSDEEEELSKTVKAIELSEWKDINNNDLTSIKKLKETWKEQKDLHFPNISNALYLNYINQIWFMLHGKTQKDVGIYRKYEEFIETLPVNFQADLKEKAGWEKVIEEIKPDRGQDSVKDNATFKYERHGSEGKEVVEYYESISGSQVYFALLYNIPQEEYTQKKTIYHLLENSMMRYVIVDERLCRFVYNNQTPSDRIDKFHNLRIYVPSVITGVISENPHFQFQILNTSIGNKLIIPKGGGNFSYQYTKEGKEINSDFDVLIIHQGILDKIFKNHYEKSNEFLQRAKNSIPIVAITSGRGSGSPSKLCEDTKFLPFSNIESYLMKEYPEKFLLTQVIAKIRAK